MSLKTSDLTAEVVRPGDEGYDDAARVFFATGRPELTSVAKDVVHTVRIVGASSRVHRRRLSEHVATLVAREGLSCGGSIRSHGG